MGISFFNINSLIASVEISCLENSEFLKNLNGNGFQIHQECKKHSTYIGRI